MRAELQELAAPGYKLSASVETMTPKKFDLVSMPYGLRNSDRLFVKQGRGRIALLMQV